MALLLPLAAVGDAGENLLHWALTGAGALAAPVASAWYLAAGLCAAFKWVGIVTFAVAALITRLRRKLDIKLSYPVFFLSNQPRFEFRFQETK